MKHLIDKDALVAEIEKRRDSLISLSESCPANTAAKSGFYAQAQTLEGIKNFIDTLEVKETGTENHINCKVGWYDGVFLDYTQEQLSTLLDKIGANVGDEVKIYITK